MATGRLMSEGGEQSTVYTIPRKYQRVRKKCGLTEEQYLAVLRWHSPALVASWGRPDVAADWLRRLGCEGRPGNKQGTPHGLG